MPHNQHVSGYDAILQEETGSHDTIIDRGIWHDKVAAKWTEYPRYKRVTQMIVIPDKMMVLPDSCVVSC